MSDPLEVVIVEDHLAVRKGFEMLLRSEGVRIAGVAATLSEARHLLSRRRCDVVLLDLSLPDGSALSLVREHQERGDGSAVIILTGATDPGSLDAAAHCGARGFVLKSSPPGELIEAVRRVSRGGTYVDPGLRGMMHPRPLRTRLSTLSPREREILDLLAGGLNGEEIAQRLVISPETVRTHVRNAMSKLDARTRAHAVALAVSGRAA